MPHTDGNMHISGASAISDVCINAATLAPFTRGMVGSSVGGGPSLRGAWRNRCGQSSLGCEG